MKLEFIKIIMQTLLYIINDIKEDWRFYLATPFLLALGILANHGSPKAEIWLYKLNDLTWGD